MNKIFSDIAWSHYLYWQSEDKRILKKINELIRDIERNGNSGLGKPEPLKHELSGYWSRRITEVHRLIYSIDESNIYIASSKTYFMPASLNIWLLMCSKSKIVEKLFITKGFNSSILFLLFSRILPSGTCRSALARFH